MRYVSWFRSVAEEGKYIIFTSKEGRISEVKKGIIKEVQHNQYLSLWVVLDRGGWTYDYEIDPSKPVTIIDQKKRRKNPNGRRSIL